MRLLVLGSADVESNAGSGRRLIGSGRGLEGKAT
jgi:hypothetical protein